MMLWLRPEQAREILAAAQAAAPDESCGLLLGRGGDVIYVRPARNADPQPARGFVVAPDDLAAALALGMREDLDLVGIYHSHPAGHPIPSERDIAEANYPDALNLIVGLAGSAPEMAAWRIARGRVSRAELYIQAARPLHTEPAGLLPVQRLAVIAAGVLAVALVIFLAVSLLPPPQLPT